MIKKKPFIIHILNIIYFKFKNLINSKIQFLKIKFNVVECSNGVNCYEMFVSHSWNLYKSLRRLYLNNRWHAFEKL